MDQTLLERVNPVFNTAKMTVYQLAATGNSDAAEIAKKLNLSFEQTQNSESSTASPEQMAAGLIMMETRYRTIEAMAQKSGCGTVVDLPCGYTPRAKVFANDNTHYIGLDLPAAIAEAQPAIMSLIDDENRSKARFCGVDATNGASLKNALKDVSGPVCITTEGLLMYFTDSETGMLCDNIHMILKEHGGCWLTADPESPLQYVLTIQPIAGERFMEIMNNAKNTTQDKSDVAVGNNSLIIHPAEAEECIKKAMMFLASHGLKAERVIVGENMPEIASMSKLSSEQAQAIKQNMQKIAFWKITALDNSVAVDTSDLKGKGFEMKASVESGALVLDLTGRVDTLTAPNMLALYERAKAEQSFTSVLIDCDKLEYISSAGLRVLLIMQKQCPNGVKLKGVNSAVKEILEQSGFDSILDVED
ncbi:MAG: STAS domain-containing protein [Ruminococcus sp.]|nr:STAS domain-containing protein [Ruminococcus sp.]